MFEGHRACRQTNERSTTQKATTYDQYLYPQASSDERLRFASDLEVYFCRARLTILPDYNAQNARSTLQENNFSKPIHVVGMPVPSHAGVYRSPLSSQA